MTIGSRRDAADRINSAAIHLLRRVRRGDDAAMGISPPRASALSVLVFGGPRSLTELADAERVTVPTMSKLVGAMEREGLLRREPHRTDGRAVVLRATAKGRRILERGRERRLDLLEALLADATPAELESVRRAAAVIERALASG
jgi:DNA-binding MarR family transcriptional regulator